MKAQFKVSLIAFAAFLTPVPPLASLADRVVTLTAEGKQPRVAVGSGGKVAIVYGQSRFEELPRHTVILCRVSKDGGNTYAEPVEVGRLEHTFLGMRRGPQVAITEQTIAVLAVDSQNGNLLAWHSRDWGRTWASPVQVNDVNRAAREGMHAVTAGDDNTLLAVWLDLRVKGTRLYGSRSTDGGNTWSENFLIYKSPAGTICQCCHPSATADAKGNFYVMWRNWLQGSRDMYLATSTNGGHSFGKALKLGKGTWELDGCPMAGGWLAANSPKNVMTFWRREHALYECRLDGKEHLVGEGRQPAVGLGPGGSYKLWQADGNIMYASPGDDAPVSLGEGVFPVIAAAPKGRGPVIAAWQTEADQTGGIVCLRLSGSD